MSDVYDLSYKADRAETLNAMQEAGRSVFRGPKAWLLWVQWGFLCVLAPMGAVAFFMIVVISMTGETRIEPFWILPVIYLVTGFLALMLLNRSYAVLAEASVQSRFGSENRIVMGPDGFKLHGGDSLWQMPWSDVEDVRLGKKAIAIVTGGVALPVPVSAFEDRRAAEAAFADVQTWMREP